MRFAEGTIMLRENVSFTSLLALTLALAATTACQPRDLPRSEPSATGVMAPAPTRTTAPPTRPPGAAPPPPATTSEPPPMACATLRDVGVSDVVRIDGRTLFYADGAAGLTIVDVSDAASPRPIALVPFIGNPSALFVQEGIAWVIFVDVDSRFLAGKPATVIRAVDVRNPKVPRIIGQEVREGSTSIAKLVDTYLYVMRPVGSGTAVESFDVRDGGLRALDEVMLEGAPAQLAASSAGLAAVTLVGDHTSIAWLDLSMERPGAIALRESVRVAGGVATWERGEGRLVDADEGQRVRLVTCATRSCSPQEGTTLRIVDFGKPRRAPLDALRLTEQGGLPLTRFTDDGLVVADASLASRDTTSLRIVRTDDAGARFVGRVDVRGMLSGLVPREGSLVALGTVGAPDAPVNVVIHDIDMRRPTAPRVRGTFTFGGDWTWSVALDDERALSFDPASNLVAIPFTAWRKVDKRYVTGTQLVALGAYPGEPRSALPGEGFIERAVFLDGHLVTIGPGGITPVDYASMRRPDLAEHELQLNPVPIRAR